MSSRVKIANTAKAKERLTLIIVFILFLDLFTIYLGKYSRKNLSILEFNPESLGNILNFISILIPVSGLVVLLYIARADIRKYYYFLVITLFMNIPLVIASLFKHIRLPRPIEYLFGFPLERVYVGGFYSLFQLCLFFLGFLIWLQIFRVEKKLYFLSFLYSLVLVIIFSCWTFIYTNDDYDSGSKYFRNGKKADVAVILGAAVWSKNKASPIFASRIGKACNLYNAGTVKKIQVTGGNAPGELSEAEVAFKLLTRYGVEPSDIWVEKRSGSTSEQIEFIKENLVKKRNLSRIIIISDNFHLKRVMENCKFFNVNAEGISSDLQLSWEKSIYYRFRESMALLVFWFFAL